ncbi:MAG: dTDP-4-dehydrorhamnose 3,5-epimerase [Candidatus Cloacimonetes bacterium]|nr:dTDP-4-dehydrorhamnose 3,5-epimerase [Candidatus Cloacimonadota bacterium]MCF7884803.1 dTDP-4-dehydrorhamnose 3,5-epimerase [Candidatus Cloacimonadota bacterium]
MKIENTKIKDLKIITPDIFSDERGYFFEMFHTKKFKEMEIPINFVQDNQSFSKYRTIRGLHYQIGEFAQGKLVHVVQGKILDVAVDIRFSSPTFGKYFSIELSDSNQKFIWIPPGFAHGFSVLSETAVMFYKCTAVYSPTHERGILFNDPDLNIDWKIENPLVSEKDRKNSNFREIEKDFVFRK